jgi:threonine aldolase
VNVTPEIVAALQQRGWQFYAFIGERGHRFMCSWQTTAAAVDELLADARACASASAG